MIKSIVIDLITIANLKTSNSLNLIMTDLIDIIITRLFNNKLSSKYKKPIRSTSCTVKLHLSAADFIDLLEIHKSKFFITNKRQVLKQIISLEHYQVLPSFLTYIKPEEQDVFDMLPQLLCTCTDSTITHSYVKYLTNDKENLYVVCTRIANICCNDNLYELFVQIWGDYKVRDGELVSHLVHGCIVDNNYKLLKFIIGQISKKEREKGSEVQIDLLEEVMTAILLKRVEFADLLIDAFTCCKTYRRWNCLKFKKHFKKGSKLDIDGIIYLYDIYTKDLIDIPVEFEDTMIKYALESGKIDIVAFVSTLFPSIIVSRTRKSIKKYSKEIRDIIQKIKQENKMVAGELRKSHPT